MNGIVYITKASQPARNGRRSQADLSAVFFLAMLSVLGVAMLAFAGSYQKDGLEDSFKASHGISTNIVAPEALAGWWQMNETNGLSTVDRSANALPLVMNAVDGSSVPPSVGAEGGPVWRPGLYDNAAQLGGTYFFAAQVAGAPGQAAYGLGGDFTFSAWVKTEPATDWQVIARWKDTANGSWEIGTGTDGKLRVRFDTAAGSNQVVQSAGPAVESVKDSGWHQVALVYIAATGEARAYRDGRLEAARVIAGSLGTAVSEFRIGDKGYGVSWKGLIDEVRLYKKALTPMEVASLPATYSDLGDEDGLNTLQEMLMGTDPADKDSDHDGIPDGAEVALGLNATNAADASLLGNSGLTRLQEYRFGLDAASATTGGAVAPAHLVGYWPFELNGTNASLQLAYPNYVFDHSASVLPGRLVGVPATDRSVAFGPGKTGSALVLSGNGASVEVKPSSAAVLGDYTVAAWVRTSNTASSNSIFQWQDASGFGFELGVNNLGAARARIDTSAATQGQVNQVVQNWSSNAKLIGDNQWHHVALTFVASSRTAFLYVDGSLEASRQIAGTHGTSAQSIRIGSGWNASWAGSLDEVRMWDTVLTPEQIGALYAPSVAGTGTGTGTTGSTETTGGTSSTGTTGTTTPSTNSSPSVATTSTPAEAPVGDRLAAIVKHRPQINGRLDGSVQQLLPEDVTLNSGATVTGDLLIPGVPQLTQNGSTNQITFSGIKTGTGTATPTNHRLTLNSGSALRYLATR
ncbi:MAG TPA: LamG domain-containing protein, partial [Candidatus Methylacidiphilales bacterium]|nr:LamG domain-containing protein [Candidatus Methylacidiphilales bacterium]